MSYPIMHIIGIRVGGVFSDLKAGDAAPQEIKDAIREIVAELDAAGDRPPLDIESFSSLSGILGGTKGVVIVLAGVFNCWFFPEAAEFSRRLSERLGTEVIHTYWAWDKDHAQCDVLRDGHRLSDVYEGPIERILRRIC